jgi:hypothetical protein
MNSRGMPLVISRGSITLILKKALNHAYGNRPYCK